MTRTLQEREYLNSRFPRPGVTRVKINDEQRMWRDNTSTDFEHAFRRTSNRSGAPSRNIEKAQGNSRIWQWYCSDPAFDEFGDTFMLDAPREALANSTLTSLPGSVREANWGSIFPNCLARVGKTKCGGSTYPACSDVVDLQQPLVACVRGSVRQRISAAGHGKMFPRVCRTTSGQCDPLPNVTLF